MKTSKEDRHLIKIISEVVSNSGIQTCVANDIENIMGHKSIEKSKLDPVTMYYVDVMTRLMYSLHLSNINKYEYVKNHTISLVTELVVSGFLNLTENDENIDKGTLN